MKVVIGSDKKGFELRKKVRKHLEDGDYEILDIIPKPVRDFVESSLKVMHEVLDRGIKKAIMSDEYDVDSAMAPNRVKGVVTADVDEEKTGHIAAMHDGAKALAIDSDIIGEKLAELIVDCYLYTEYAGGRHQARSGMLEKMTWRRLEDVR